MRLPCPEHTREAKAAPAWVNVSKTLGQIAVFWGFFLAVVPFAIVRLEGHFGIAGFVSPASRMAGAALFCSMGCVGVYCGMVFAVHGSGTPLPLDTTTKLVIAGPYRVVRNPMAITGICQGIAVGLYLGSPFTVLYSLAGIAAWDYMARPWEEEDLLRRFGEPYRQYREAVRCWIPRLRPYPRLVPGRTRE
ncbi:MAG TPA: isoprenylcysteine carboxylmethyltransferase family protein [Fimbriimonadaceae bacterium]|nr:isoprenylcysteine carboxylmethyltransferase family protein [Fimbriimonadaceae bacterium]